MVTRVTLKGPGTVWFRDSLEDIHAHRKRLDAIQELVNNQRDRETFTDNLKLYAQFFVFILLLEVSFL